MVVSVGLVSMIVSLVVLISSVNALVISVGLVTMIVASVDLVSGMIAAVVLVLKKKEKNLKNYINQYIKGLDFFSEVF
jgi:hypothetical protein